MKTTKLKICEEEEMKIWKRNNVKICRRKRQWKQVVMKLMKAANI